MVVCKFYRQGNCRYGQYCQFDHINNFGGDKPEDDIAGIVAKEILLAERGGQWLLTCFGPIKDRPCIPGMEDVSPEEIRWEIYQAQKNGVVEQAKLHFQQLCQNMKAKRDVLKNPTEETRAKLNKLLEGNQENRSNTNNNTGGKSSTFFFAAPQLGLANNTSASNVFGNKSFSMQNNPFSGGFNSSTNESVFGRSNNTNSIFGGNTFGNNIGFGTASNNNPIFGGNTNTSTFSNVQNTQTFGIVAPQNNPVFGGSPQGLTNQTNVFGTQLGNAFVSGTSSNTLFNSPITSQANNSVFGGTKTTTANFYENSSSLQGNPGFGTATSTGSFNNNIFNTAKTMPAFGGTPVFGGVTNYVNNSGSRFNGQAFATPATSNIFVGSATTTPSFGLAQQPNAFGTTASTSTSNVFATQSNAISVGNATLFGRTSAPINNPFVTSSQFESTNTNSTPFANTGFGLSATSTSNTFGNSGTSSNPLFANAGTTFPVSSNANVLNLSPFSASTFNNSSAPPFGSTNTITTTTAATTTNPFAPRGQQNSTSFGNTLNQVGTNNITASPFGNSPFKVAPTNTNSIVIDDSIYTTEGLLTDDEKNMYLAEKFIFGKIPLKPPTKDIR